MIKLRRLAFIILLSIAGKFSYGQNVFTINNLYPKDTIVNGWIFHSGDNTAWAGPDFDDKEWRPIDPGIDITQFNELKKVGIGWIRVHITADSGVTKKRLTAWVFQYTASENYVDGKLIRKYGKIALNPSETEAYSPSGDMISLNFTPNAEHVIAVRLAYEKGLPYSSPYFIPLSAFRIYVNSFSSAFDNYRQNQGVQNINAIVSALFAGIFLIISLIYLIYFIFDRQQKVNLYYCLYSFFVFLLNFTFTFFVNNIQSVKVQMWTSFGEAICFILSSLLMLVTVYTLFDYNKRIVFKILITAGIISLIYLLFSDITGFIMSTTVFLEVCMLEGIRLSVWAIKYKKKGAVFILVGLVISSGTNVWSAFLDQTTLQATLLALLAIFGFPLGMSVYLGIQNAQTNKKLRFTLIEVQTLSEQSLLKEQEKQALLASQNERLELDVSVRTAELNMSLNTLKSTQAQLIQSEKMASLGELTAGIAHEIQNPLNFVNNFSEVSIELLKELKAESEKEKAERDEQLEVELINDLIENQTKINHHGKRADSIVKGMLEHSRTRSGQKELTDINALADEYLRLSYHGLRAKDKSFNAEMVTHFDTQLPKTNVVPQDIGRVMMNLFNNAFYAVNQKKETAGDVYKPEVMVSTTNENGKIGIKVKDNGNGIPEAIREKIMQPFFTTKPTGEGTGLGLSLSYDIIVKAHNGSINVNSTEGEGSEFIISLPINS